MIPNLVHLIMIIMVLIPWPVIYCRRAAEINVWAAIGIGFGQVGIIILLLVWDETWMMNYKKNNRKPL